MLFPFSDRSRCRSGPTRCACRRSQREYWIRNSRGCTPGRCGLRPWRHEQAAFRHGDKLWRSGHRSPAGPCRERYSRRAAPRTGGRPHSPAYARSRVRLETGARHSRRVRRAACRCRPDAAVGPTTSERYFGWQLFPPSWLWCSWFSGSALGSPSWVRLPYSRGRIEDFPAAIGPLAGPCEGCRLQRRRRCQRCTIRFPHTGPYDEQRLGYDQLPSYVERLEPLGFAITRQARMSPRLIELQERKLFIRYREKNQAGLTVRDCRDAMLLHTRVPTRVYERFEEVPPLLVSLRADPSFMAAAGVPVRIADAFLRKRDWRVWRPAGRVGGVDGHHRQRRRAATDATGWRIALRARHALRDSARARQREGRTGVVR